MKTQAEILVAQTVPAGEPGGGSAGGLNFLLLMGALFLFMYAILFRPQQKQQKAHREMLSKVAKGDQIVTSGGIHGRVTGVAGDVLTVEIAERTRVKLNRSGVASRSGGSEGEKKS